MSNSVIQPALALVNQQLRVETLPIFYRVRPFRIDSLDHEGKCERAKRWLTAIQPHLHILNKVEIRLCCTHGCILKIKAAPGKKPNCELSFGDRAGEKTSIGSTFYKLSKVETNDLRYLFEGLAQLDHCDYEIVDSTKIGDTRSLCKSVGANGFGSEDYIRAAKPFLFPVEKRCTAGYYPDSDMEDDGD